MNEAIQKDVAKRGITRLCHFTPSRSLAHILAGGAGILPSRLLAEEDRLLFNPTDLQRLDGHADHICCSIEYPNAWYLDRARKGEILFRDWVVIFVDPAVLALEGTLFCPRNAAAGSGSYIAAGYDAYASMFAQSVPGAQGVLRSRSLLHLPCSPTDDQAEVLVPESIPPASIMAIGVSSEEQARAEHIRLMILGIDIGNLKFVVSPTLFDKYALSSSIRAGQKQSETLWTA
ncbi:DarT ssDNA thymidine ADP-ribosyltransferase family protein [Pelagibacterium sp.]|uniref:DarT ssDNA thymidine ADP-ribosyltransferase family protein n=1 Tax=Pelagibacterium sp. TaxID=1967288 RepID=UPI003A940D2C